MGVVGMGCCGDGWGCVLGWSAPLGRPVALTLALSCRAGEGTVVVVSGIFAAVALLWERIVLRVRGCCVGRSAKNSSGGGRATTRGVVADDCSELGHGGGFWHELSFVPPRLWMDVPSAEALAFVGIERGWATECKETLWWR